MTDSQYEKRVQLAGSIAALVLICAMTSILYSILDLRPGPSRAIAHPQTSSAPADPNQPPPTQ